MAYSLDDMYDPSQPMGGNTNNWDDPNWAPDSAPYIPPVTDPAPAAAAPSVGVTDPTVRAPDPGAAPPGAIAPLTPGADRVVAGPSPLLPDGSPNPAWRQNMTTPATLAGMYGGAPGAPTGGGGRNDEATIRAQIAKWAAMPGADPSLSNDPDYWVKAITSRGGLGSDNMQYWQDASVGSSAFFRNPNREGGGNGSQASGGGMNNSGGQGGLASFLTDSPLLQPWTTPFNYADWKAPAAFTAPTTVDEQNDPGYKFRMQMGQQAIERSAAAKGTLLTGGTAKDLTQFGQDYGSGEYQNVYGRALTDYTTGYNSSLTDWTTNYNKAHQGYMDSYNIFQNNQANQYNRIAGLAGLGQVATSQLGSQGLGYAQLNTGTNTGTANTLGNLYTGAGNAGAAGTVGVGNAIGQGIGSATNLADLYALRGGTQPPANTSLYGKGGGNGTSYDPNMQNGYG